MIDFRLSRFLCAFLAAFCVVFADDNFLGAKCEKFNHSDIETGYAFSYACFYAHHRAIEAYKSFRNEILSQYPNDDGYKNLRVELIAGENTLDRITEKLTIGYYWKSEKELSVNIEYDDKVAAFDFVQSDRGTKLNYYLYR
ncbi:MAG: hypothetical protein LBO72_05670 [Helicobacteraceae bacterium]|nr:hypothetical protein [Helicobacteraceae bacterium]